MSICPHADRELRCRIFADGSAHFGHQCKACGDAVVVDGKMWIPHADVQPGRVPRPWDEQGDKRQPSIFDRVRP